MKIDLNVSLYDFVKQHPEAVPFLVSQGLSQVEDESMLEVFGKQVSLKQMLTMRSLNPETFSERLQEVITPSPENTEVSKDKTLHILGALPCPVRLPLQESFDAFVAKFQQTNPDCRIKSEMKAASSGAAWMEEHITGVDDPALLPDIFISAGFETFFDKKSIGRFRDSDVFFDGTGIDEFNADFSGTGLQDPKRMYSIISVVPAVFLVNTELLDGRPLPSTWQDILSPEFEKKVSLPVGDFDLFNGILLAIYKKYGADGVRQLGRSLLKSLHPSEMVKSNRKPEPPVVTISSQIAKKSLRARRSPPILRCTARRDLGGEAWSMHTGVPSGVENWAKVCSLSPSSSGATIVSSSTILSTAMTAGLPGPSRTSILFSAWKPSLRYSGQSRCR